LAYARKTEVARDAFAIENNGRSGKRPGSERKNVCSCQAIAKLGVYPKLNPTPLEEFIFYDHPSGRARIRMAMDWKAANLPAGESPKSESQNPKQTEE
jgi:hypothetical protein